MITHITEKSVFPRSRRKKAWKLEKENEGANLQRTKRMKLKKRKGSKIGGIERIVTIRKRGWMKGTKEFKGRKNRTKKSESKGKPKGWSRSGIGVARNEIKGGERERGTRRRIIGRETLVIKLKKGWAFIDELIRIKRCYARDNVTRRASRILAGFRSNYLTRDRYRPAYPLDHDVFSHPSAVIAAFSTHRRRLT